MTPNLLKDPDFKRFQAELQHTDVGQRFRRAWNDMHRALKLMTTPAYNGGVPHFSEQKIDFYRREYIKASERASDAVYELSVRFMWPAGAQAPSNFMWKPSAPKQRQRRSAP